VTALPGDRGWDLERLYHPDPDQAGTVYARGGGFLAGANRLRRRLLRDQPPREALAMDPRSSGLLLEGAWEAFEDAGIDPGVAARHRHRRVLRSRPPPITRRRRRGDLPDLEGFRLTGATTSVVSGRVAYSLGLEGPAVSVDTACSSSLVAMHPPPRRCGQANARWPWQAG